MASVTPTKSIWVNVIGLVCVVLAAVVADKADLTGLFGAVTSATIASSIGILNVVLHSLSSPDAGPAAS
jgi:hypothetical protein